MINQLKNLIYFCLFFPLLSCGGSESYFSAYQSKLRIIERQDHQKCVSQGLDYGEWDDIITEIYWRCRYNLVMDRKINDVTTAESIRNNRMVEQIAEEMLKNLNRAKYSSLTKIEDDIESSSRSKCIDFDPSLNVKNSNVDDDICREELILLAIPSAPKIINYFELTLSPKDRGEYLKIANEIRSRKKEETKAMVLRKYPNCVELNIGSRDFKKCVAAEGLSKQCLETIEALQIKKELQDKIYCERQAFAQFPDNYALAKDKSSSEIEKLRYKNKKEKDQEIIQENNEALFYLEGKKTVSGNIGRDVENDNDDETKAKEQLYSRAELVKLRERFSYQCNKKMEEKLPEFAVQKSNECFDIARNWKK